MKRYNNLFDQGFSQENLYQAFLTARKGKRNKKSCFEFEKSLGYELDKLRIELYNGSYKPKPYFSFIIQEAKPRKIYAPAFRDVVVQHAIYRIIYPIFDKTFIDTSFACRKGKGTHRCGNYVQWAMRQVPDNAFTLHLDVSKFFYSIDSSILIQLVAKKIKDYKLLEVMAQFMVYSEPLGIPIGNLLSQLFALIYLNPIDHFIKRELKIKYYVRYVDDMMLIGLTKQEANEYAKIIEQQLLTLHLRLSKTLIKPIKKGVNFVGYRTWQSRRFVRKHSLYQFSKSLKKKDIASITSLMAHAKNTSTFSYYCKRIVNEELIFEVPIIHSRTKFIKMAK